MKLWPRVGCFVFLTHGVYCFAQVCVMWHVCEKACLVQSIKMTTVGHNISQRLLTLLYADTDANAGKALEPECAIELKEIRRSLLEDYRISPSVSESCEDDVKIHCDKVERREVIHCLMDVARHQYRVAGDEDDGGDDDGDADKETPVKRKRLTRECYREVRVTPNSRSH